MTNIGPTETTPKKAPLLKQIRCLNKTPLRKRGHTYFTKLSMDLELAECMKRLKPSMTLAVTAQAAKLTAEGKKVFNFGAGEPDFGTPKHIVDAAVTALEEGKTRYTEVRGIAPLREAIATKLAADNNLSYSAAQITVSTGAKQALYNALLATCGPGDEVIIPAPYWTSYMDMVHLVGATPIVVETTQETGWKMTPELFENSMSPLTKLVILNSPSNPTGAVYTKAELEALAEVITYEEILVISDEIYEKLVYGDTQHVSFGSLSPEAAELTITINGFSKAWAMTGWRLGYSAAPHPIAKAINAIQSHTTSNVTNFAQYGALAALEGSQKEIADMREEFDVRRQFMIAKLNETRGIKLTEPQGAFYVLADISATGLSSINFAEKLLSKHNVAVVPGAAFGNDNTIRLSYACSFEDISEGLNALEDFCKSY